MYDLRLGLDELPQMDANSEGSFQVFGFSSCRNCGDIAAGIDMIGWLCSDLGSPDPPQTFALLRFGGPSRVEQKAVPSKVSDCFRDFVTHSVTCAGGDACNPIRCATTSKPHNSKTSKLHNLKTSKPENPKTWKPQNSKTLKPENLTTWKPQNLKTSKLQNLPPPTEQYLSEPLSSLLGRPSAGSPRRYACGRSLRKRRCRWTKGHEYRGCQFRSRFSLIMCWWNRS